MSKESNIEIFEDTKYLYENTPKLIDAIKYSKDNQRIIFENDEIALFPSNREGKVIVSQKRSFEAAKEYTGKKVAVLNFASATNPGGGVLKGSSAQEECLCRTSTLYPCLNTKTNWNNFYTPHRNERNALNNDDIIYTPDVVVFREDTIDAQFMEEKDWYKVNIITCAAPNLRDNPSNRYNPDNGSKVEIEDAELFDLHVKRFSKILEVAAFNHNQVVILGAFGCGAFLNPPEVVASAAKVAIEKYRQYFDTIEFAIYCGNSKQNYEAFRNTLTK